MNLHDADADGGKESPDNDAEIGPNDILNDFCLLQIFNRLDLNDLCNASDINHQFRRVSKMMFSGRSGPYATINYPQHFELSSPHPATSCETVLRRVLCKFGVYIKSMHLEELKPNDDFSVGKDPIEFKLVSTFCAGTMEELSLKANRLQCDEWAKPLFSSLKTLILNCTGLDGDIQGLFSVCQELKTLQLNIFFDADYLAQNYRKLEELLIGEFVCPKTTLALLQMNQQIKKLDMCDDNKMINDMAPKMVDLEQLILRKVLPETFSNDTNVPQLADLKSLKHLELHNDSFYTRIELNPHTAEDVGPTFCAAVEASLKNVPFECFKWFNCPSDLQFTKGIAKLLTLKSLTLTGISFPFDDCLAEFGAKLPLLRELELGFDHHKEPLLSIDCLIKFIKQKTKLDTLTVRTIWPDLFDQKFYDALLAVIQQERWLEITIFCNSSQSLKIHSSYLQVKFVQTETCRCPCMDCSVASAVDLLGQNLLNPNSDSDSEFADFDGVV